MSRNTAKNHKAPERTSKHKGRPNGKAKMPIRNFRFTRKADGALVKLAGNSGWTMTLATERAILFASTHPDFNRQDKPGRERQLVAQVDSYIAERGRN